MRDYDASHGLEHFLSFETPDRRTIFAFCRLRVGGQPGGRDDGQSHVNSSGRKRRNNNSSSSSKASSSEEGSGDVIGSGDKDSVADAMGEVVFPELQDCALVRELHVYGQLATADATSKHLAAAPAGASSSSSSNSSSSSSSGSAPTVAESGSSVVELEDDSHSGSLDDSTNSKTSSHSTTSGSLLSAAAATIGTKREKSKSQHVGLGTRLMQHAEKMAAYHGYGKVAVISGVGVRHYYRRLGSVGCVFVCV